MGPDRIRELVMRALEEDLGDGDVTTRATVPADARARAVITQKQPGVLAGIEVAVLVFLVLDPAAEIERHAVDGVWREGGEVLEVTGRADKLLAGERTALNFLQHLSGIATATARAVDATGDTGTRILDTRKTTPGMRALEKEAVRAGGGFNHRAGLYDMVLIKENHAALAGGVGAAVRAAREAFPELPLEVECRHLAEVDEALEAGAPRLLLDNMTPDQIGAVVERVDGRAELEASGGVTPETVGDYAQQGLDFISLGAITHSASALDLSLLLEPLP